MTQNFRLTYVLLIVLWMALLPSSSHEELNKSYYATLQYVAPEALTIRIKKTVVTRTSPNENELS